MAAEAYTLFLWCKRRRVIDSFGFFFMGLLFRFFVWWEFLILFSINFSLSFFKDILCKMCCVVSFYKISKVKSFLFNKYKQTYYIEIINRFHCMNCFAFDITNSILWSNRSTYKKRKRF